MYKLSIILTILFTLNSCLFFSNGKIVERGDCKTTDWTHLYKNETTPTSSEIILVNTSNSKKIEFTVKEYLEYSDCKFGDCKDDSNFKFREIDEDTDIIVLNPGEEKVLTCKVRYLTYPAQVSPPFTKTESRYEIVGEREVQ